MQILLLLACLTSSVWGVFWPANSTRVLHSSGRHLVHMHIETAAMFGNSTQMMYFYSNVYVGDFNNPSRQSLIVDTGSGLTCFPCENYCTHCGKHINSYYPLDQSTTKEILDCRNESCSCILDNK